MHPRRYRSVLGVGNPSWLSPLPVPSGKRLTNDKRVGITQLGNRDCSVVSNRLCSLVAGGLSVTMQLISRRLSGFLRASIM